MSLETFPFPIQIKEFKETKQANRIDVAFGGGYSESYNRDPQGPTSVFKISFTHKKEYIDQVIAFIERYLNGDPFYLVNPINQRTVTVRVEPKYVVSFPSIDFGTVEFQCKEVRTYG